jgi:hypothetical protein
MRPPIRSARNPHTPPTSWLRSLTTVACLVAVMTSVAGCQQVPPGSALGSRFTRAALTASATPSPPAPSPAQVPLPKVRLIPHLGLSCVPTPHSFSCLMQQRIRKVKHYLASRPGQIGVVLHDRKTGATWGNAYADTDFPAASTVKLAMITDLLLRRRSGAVDLGSYDFELIDSVLRSSSDTAADQLWFSFEDGGFLQRIRRFGMRTASFTSSAYWGFMYCSPRDLDGLMNYVLSDIPAGDRVFIARRLRHVSAIQQWGVWGAGRDNDPGNKDGWEYDGGVWIVNTVGFAGRGARYTLAIMDDLGGAGDFHQGTTILNQISALLFQGHYGPVPTVEATP